MAHPCLSHLMRNGICGLELGQHACRKATYADTLVAPRVQLVEKRLQGSNVYAIAVNGVCQPFPDFGAWTTIRKINSLEEASHVLQFPERKLFDDIGGMLVNHSPCLHRGLGCFKPQKLLKDTFEHSVF